MKQQLVAGLMSLGIAFTGVTAPTASRADTRDVALIVGSAIALFALKEVLEDKDKKKKSSTTYSSRNRQKDDALYYKNGRGHAYGHDKKNKKGKKNKNRRDFWQSNRYVPRECFYRYEGRNGMRGVFGERCVADVTGSARYLPDACRLNKGRQFRRAPAYDAACLRDRGYRVEARRR